MNREEIIEQIMEIAKEVFQKENLVFSEDLDASSVDTWTSLSFMLFLTKVEETYGFKFKMFELLKLKNMGAVVDAITNHLS